VNRRAPLPVAALLLGASLLSCGGAPRPRGPAPEQPLAGDPGPGQPLPQDPAFFPQAMRELVQALGAYARVRNPRFLVVPQNGLGLLTEDGTPEGGPVEAYLRGIDGVGQEELYYGFPRDDRPTPPEETDYLLGFLRGARTQGKRVLIIDYCRSPDAVADSRRRASAQGFLSFAAPRRELDLIPPFSGPASEHGEGEVLSLDTAKNFLYLINSGRFGSARAFVDAVAGTDYDLLVVDAFVEDGERGPRWLTATEVHTLQRKPSGARRLVLAYLSVGEAESYRYYWRRQWDRFADGTPDQDAPPWLERENPRWPGNYKVRYWDPRWQAILFGQADAYLDGILARGYDGVYLDLVDAYLYYQERLQAIQD
jgi:cysteinyl-tRNA synthetase